MSLFGDPSSYPTISQEWGFCHQVMFIAQHEENKSQVSSSIKMEEDSMDEDEKTVKTKTLFSPKYKKRKRLSLGQLREMKAELGGTQMQSCEKLKTEKHESRDRWSAKRYEQAEQSMWEVLKAEGATFANPIPRHALRKAARKHIGDTGLLDHLLKHIDGKVAPAGTDRFRRWFNTQGIMEYWLESADLEKVRHDAGVQDPYWLPSMVRPGSSPPLETGSSDELILLRTEMAQMKRDMQELLSKKDKKNEMSLLEETHKELVKWKAMTEQRLSEIMTSLKDMQEMYGQFVIWKTKVEQQLGEIKNKLSDLQSSKAHTTLGPSERWEPWLESTNLGILQGDELAPWFGSTEVLNVEPEVIHQDHNLSLPTQLLNGELTNMKSDMLDVVPKNQEDDRPNVTPDSSITVNSKSDLDNSFILFQEMFMDLFKWKDKMEQQMLEVSNIVYGMLAMK